MTSKELIKILENLGLEPRSYSGRGMYGAECVGVYVKNLGDHEFPIGWKHDNLGKGYHVYWPKFSWFIIKKQILRDL